MAPGNLEGEGTVRINFVPQETLLEYKGVGTMIAKQIMLARKISKNKLNKEDFHTYGIHKKGETVIRHFDFTVNPDDTCLEDEEFEYYEKSRGEDVDDRFEEQAAANSVRCKQNDQN